MLTYTGLRNLYGDLTEDESSTNLTLGDTLINLATQRLLSSFHWPFLVRSGTATTVASQQFYDLPYNFKKLTSLYITVSSTRYVPRKIVDSVFWD